MERCSTCGHPLDAVRGGCSRFTCMTRCTCGHVGDAHQAGHGCRACPIPVGGEGRWRHEFKAAAQRRG